MASSGVRRRFGVRVCRFVFVCCARVRVGLRGGCWYIFRRFAVFSALARLHVFVEIFKTGSGVEIGVKSFVLGLEQSIFLDRADNFFACKVLLSW